MQHHPIALPIRSTVIAALVVALALALASSAPAKPEQILTERAGDKPAAALPQVGDRPSERTPTTAAPVNTSSSSTTQSSDDSDSWPLIAGLSLFTVALLGTGTYVARRRRHVAPGH